MYTHKRGREEGRMGEGGRKDGRGREGVNEGVLYVESRWFGEQCKLFLPLPSGLGPFR